MREDRIRSIAIIGGGTAGWMTAAALSKVLGRDYATITLVESDAIGTVGVGEATIPQINVFNRMLGIDEDEFVRRTKGSFKLGIQFVDWGRIGDRYVHGFGTIGHEYRGLPFHQYWLKLQSQGKARDLGEYSINTAAAPAGCFVEPPPCLARPVRRPSGLAQSSTRRQIGPRREAAYSSCQTARSRPFRHRRAVQN